MKRSRVKRPRDKNQKMDRVLTDFIMIIFVLFAIYLVTAFEPMTKKEHIAKFNKMNDEVEPFRKNLTECSRQVKASMVDIENFLKRIPQTSMQGKCFVACILKRNAIIRNNKVDDNGLLEANRAVYGDDSEVMSRLKAAVGECKQVVDNIFEICEYASIFNDCMHMKMEHILDKVTLERRMEALGQMSSDTDTWTDEEDEMLKLLKDEL
uniref:Odorant-binding protein 3 n=1 Tax=Chilo suppressalis TaxID=168631 RepID=M9YSD7_CHISP|nr:odorant-binding protein 3 [Chilo suppressalis]